MMKKEGKQLLSLRSPKKQIITLIIITIIVIGIILAIFVKGYTSATQKYEDMIQELEQEVNRLSDPVAVYEEASKEVDIRVINAEIQNIGELATLEYLYTDAGKFEDPAQLFGKDVPFSFTTKSFIAKWDGCIKAGVDISKVTAELDDVNKQIIIGIPTARILSHEIDSTSIETLDEKDGLFNELTVDDIRLFDSISKEAMEQRAIENGILEKAFENAESIIEKLIYTDIVKELEYAITFKIIEP